MAQRQDQNESYQSLNKARKICRIGFAGMLAAAVGETILGAMGNPWGFTYAVLFTAGSVPVLAVGYVVKQRIKNLGI